ncbi:MAG: TadE/TadG family type IV pilus assembly protein [Pseudomonadota bacterium]
MIQTLWAATRGQVAVLFALVLLPIFIAVGMAIDTARQVTAKNHLQQATDSATLAAAHVFRSGGEWLDAYSVAHYTYYHNLTTMHDDVQCTFRINLVAADAAAKAWGQCKLPTLFGAGISGLSEMKVESISHAEAIFDDVEIALAVDMSGSMVASMLDADGNPMGSRLSVLKSAASQLLDRMLVIDGGETRISVIPYNGGVNAGRWGNLALGESELEGLDANGNGHVCPSERTGTEAFTETAPDADEATTLLNPETIGSQGCKDENQIVPLTSDRSVLDAAINALERGGYTGGHRATAWSWYTLSPEWSHIWPVASSPAAYDDDVTKALVLMTDGGFNAASHTATLGEAPDQAEKLCDAMKDKGIIVFSVGIDPDADDEAMLKNCATTHAFYYDVRNGDELIAAYGDIAYQFSGIRITQ